MKRLLLIISVIFFSVCGYSQEFPASEGFYIGQKEIRPSLSLLAPDLPESKMTLTEIDWSREVKREVNLIAMMERERYEKERSSVELDAPIPTISKGEKSLIEVTNDIRIHDRSSNYDIYTGKKKIPAYEEMRVPLFSSPYHTRSRVRGYVSPYSYSPFLR
ncbi:hypothetical protein HC174_09435 [Salinimicrobium sp. CDJ15-81-2]|nr:hypothetical protein [Salinimicrobium nanhaiense]